MWPCCGLLLKDVVIGGTAGLVDTDAPAVTVAVDDGIEAVEDKRGASLMLVDVLDAVWGAECSALGCIVMAGKLLLATLLAGLLMFVPLLVLFDLPVVDDMKNEASASPFSVTGVNKLVGISFVSRCCC